MTVGGSRPRSRAGEQGVETHTLPPMTSQQSSLELCLATSSSVNTLADDIVSDATRDLDGGRSDGKSSPRQRRIDLPALFMFLYGVTYSLEGPTCQPFPVRLRSTVPTIAPPCRKPSKRVTWVSHSTATSQSKKTVANSY
jgi:hypothetical protein